MSGNGFQVAEVGSFHVGGSMVSLEGLGERQIVVRDAPPLKVRQSGEIAVGQMYVNYVRLTAAKARYPLVFWHGGGMTGTTWETKPCGAPGWQNWFLSSGFNVYVCDAVARGRASWPPFPQILPTPPLFRSREELWEVFRFGELNRLRDTVELVPHAGSAFPAESFSQFTKQIVPQWPSDEEMTLRGYADLIERIDPCVIVAHSKGASFALRAALMRPDKIKAVVAIEPSEAPRAEDGNVARLRRVPHLAIWGDYVVQHGMWGPVRKNLGAYWQRLAAAHVPAHDIDLPKLGIYGNSHMLMMDANSDQVASLIASWLASVLE